jgi:hypothetical protein
VKSDAPFCTSYWTVKEHACQSSRVLHALRFLNKLIILLITLTFTIYYYERYRLTRLWMDKNYGDFYEP